MLSEEFLQTEGNNRAFQTGVGFYKWLLQVDTGNDSHRTEQQICQAIYSGWSDDGIKHNSLPPPTSKNLTVFHAGHFLIDYWSLIKSAKINEL